MLAEVRFAFNWQSYRLYYLELAATLLLWKYSIEFCGLSHFEHYQTCMDAQEVYLVISSGFKLQTYC